VNREADTRPSGEPEKPWCPRSHGRDELRSYRGLRLTQKLEVLQSQVSGATASDPAVQALRRVLDGRYALVKVHFAKEEEVYLPLLDMRLRARFALAGALSLAPPPQTAVGDTTYGTAENIQAVEDAGIRAYLRG